MAVVDDLFDLVLGQTEARIAEGCYLEIHRFRW